MSDYKEIKSSFAKVYGSAGDALIVIGIIKAFWPLLIISFILGYSLRAIIKTPSHSISEVGIILVSTAIICSFLLLRGHQRLKNYLKGAKGEEWVSNELSFLSSEYSIFNGIRLEGNNNNLDHIVIGPTGIYIIETKNWTGSVDFSPRGLLIDNKFIKISPISQIKAQEDVLINFLNQKKCGQISVKSILCFLGTDLEKPITNINGVIVCKGDELLNVITDELNNKISNEIRFEAENVIKKFLV